MKKKVALILIFFISLFIFSVDADALMCMYKDYAAGFSNSQNNFDGDNFYIKKDNSTTAVTFLYADHYIKAGLTKSNYLKTIRVSIGGKEYTCKNNNNSDTIRNFYCDNMLSDSISCTDKESCCPQTIYVLYDAAHESLTLSADSLSNPGVTGFYYTTINLYAAVDLSDSSSPTPAPNKDDNKCSDRQNNAIYDEIDNLRKKYQTELEAISIPENATFEQYQTYESTFQSKYDEIIDKIDSEKDAIIAKYNCTPSAKMMEKVKNSISQLMTFYNRRYNEYKKKLDSLRGNTITDDEYKSLIDSAEKNKEKAEKKYKQVMINIEDLLKEFAESNKTSNCKGILDDKLVEYINMFLNWSRIAAPILLIILGSVDFSKAVIFQDKDDLKKATSTFTKRCVIAVAIFFIPTILNVLVSIFNSVSDTPLTTLKNCGIK